MPPTLPKPELETEGNGSATSFQNAVSKADAVRCLAAAIESFTAARNLSRDQLAEDICGMSKGYFSKVINGEQGDFFGLVYGKLPGDIRQDFIERLAELERLDPFALALEQLMVAAFRVIRVGRGRTLPARADRMARAMNRAGKRRVA